MENKPIPMEEKDKIEEAINKRMITHERCLYSEEKSNDVAVEFIRLVVQIAVVMFAIVGVFWNVFDNDLTNKSFGNSVATIILIKTAFALILFFLIGSLALGLLHLKRDEKFWDEVSNQRDLRFR